jgi:hypothetical protein
MTMKRAERSERYRDAEEDEEMQRKSSAGGDSTGYRRARDYSRR